MEGNFKLSTYVTGRGRNHLYPSQCFFSLCHCQRSRRSDTMESISNKMLVLTSLDLNNSEKILESLSLPDTELFLLCLKLWTHICFPAESAHVQPIWSIVNTLVVERELYSDSLQYDNFYFTLILTYSDWQGPIKTLSR